uniref:Uncharacterized protein n=1 Tax=Glossina morsitans morsitans TaxID=37546 RepID=A0A1B0FRJ5_GLOMM
LDAASAGPFTVQIQYQKWLQIYRTLSEVKPEIEITIKIGRKVCEDRFTKSPKQLSQRIDALKHLYNALGENVTQSKIFLESLIKLAHQLEDCFDIADHLIKKFECSKEILEFEDILQKSESIYEECSTSCDQVCMDYTYQGIVATYLKLTSADVIKRLTEMKPTLQNLDGWPWNVTLKQLSVPSNLQIGKLQQQVVVIVEIKSNLQTHADRVELSMTNGIKIAIKAEQREPRLMGNDDNCCC